MTCVPAAGCLTDYQTTTLFAIVDKRYRDKKATIVTLNVASGEEAAGKIGAAMRTDSARRRFPLLQLAVFPAARGDNLKPKDQLSHGQAPNPRSNHNDSTRNRTAQADASRPRRTTLGGEWRTSNVSGRPHL